MDMRYGDPELKYVTLKVMYESFFFLISNSLLYHYMLIKIINDCILPWYMRNYFFTVGKKQDNGLYEINCKEGKKIRGIEPDIAS